MTMLIIYFPRIPAAENIKLNKKGEIEGLF